MGNKLQKKVQTFLLCNVAVSIFSMGMGQDGPALRMKILVERMVHHAL